MSDIDRIKCRSVNMTQWHHARGSQLYTLTILKSILRDHYTRQLEKIREGKKILTFINT